MKRTLLSSIVVASVLLGGQSNAAAPSAHLVFTDSAVVESIRPDGTHLQGTDSAPGFITNVQGSRDGRYVAFTRQPTSVLATNLQDVWVARSDLSHAHVVAAIPGAFVSQPTWSPDGRRLAFVVGYPVGYFGIGYQAHLWVMNRDGSGRRPVAVLPGAAEQPTWSPRGDEVAFEIDAEESGAAIGVISVDANPPVPRTVSPLGLTGVDKPRWSPTGDRLSFMDASNLYVVRRDGTGLRRVSEGNNYPWNGGAVWSPDGRYLAYCLSSSGYFFGGSSGTGPWILDLRSSHPARLLDDGACFAPAWSPDGKSLAYLTAGATSGVLVIHSVRGGSRRELVSASGDDVVWTSR